MTKTYCCYDVVFMSDNTTTRRVSWVVTGISRLVLSGIVKQCQRSNRQRLIVQGESLRMG